MSIRLLILYFLFLFSSLKSQTLSTVFIDTVKIVVDNKIIYESNLSKLKFIPNNVGSTITIYNDGIYKLNLKFGYVESKKAKHLSFYQPEFYMNDSACFVHSATANYYQDCSNIIAEKCTLRNWNFKNPNMPEKFKVNLYYRLCSLAPIDTTNYLFNYRDGLWIGPDRCVEKITINYKNDKKHGLATAYYSDGVTFNVNFNNDVADNYGQGYWKNYKDRNKLKLTYALPSVVRKSCDPIKLTDSLHLVKTYNRPYFYLMQNKKEKEITSSNYLSIHSQKRGLVHDSIEYNVKGEILNFSNDTIVLRAIDINIHDFYKKNTDTLHDHYEQTKNGYAKIPVNDITKIYLSRSKWNKLCTRTALLSALSALIVAPLISIQKGGFNRDRYKKASLTSLGVMTLSISFGLGFSQKKYLLKPTKKSNKTWKIEYDAYE